MSIATKNGSVIVKSGSVAEGCGCCGGWQCYKPTSCITFLSDFAAAHQSLRLTVSTSGLTYTRSATNLLSGGPGYGFYEDFSCGGVWPLYKPNTLEACSPGFLSQWTFASRDLTPTALVLPKWSDRSTTLSNSGDPSVTYLYQTPRDAGSSANGWGFSSGFFALVRISCGGQQLSPPQAPFTVVTISASLSWLYGSADDRPLLADFSGECYGQNAVYPGGGKIVANGATQIAVPDYTPTCTPSFAGGAVLLSSEASSSFVTSCANNNPSYWPMPKGVADGMYHFQNLYESLNSTSGTCSLQVEVM